MATESRCPNCGAVLLRPEQACPFCAEAQRLLQRLTDEEEVRLCTRCGAILEPGDEDLCASCRKVLAKPPLIFARRDDRIAGWIRDRFVEPVAEREGLACPSCGAAVAPLALFCSQCGARLATPDTVPPATVPGEAAEASEGVAAETLPAAAESVPEATAVPVGPSKWEQFVAFWQEQFRPRGPMIERPHRSWGQRVADFGRGLLGLGQETGSLDTWLIILLGVLLVGLVFMVFFWAQMLGSGDVVFR